MTETHDKCAVDCTKMVEMYQTETPNLIPKP